MSRLRITLAVQMLLLASFLMVWALFWSPAGAADLCDGKAPLIKHGYLEPTEEGEGIDLFADLMMGRDGTSSIVALTELI